MYCSIDKYINFSRISIAMGIISSIMQKFSKQPKNDYDRSEVITDEMREKALETRRLNAQVKALERRKDVQDKLDILEGAITGKNKTSTMEDMFMKVIMAKLLVPQQSNSVPDMPIYGGAEAPQQQEQSMTDKQINDAVKVIKKKLPTEAQQFLIEISDADMVKIKHKLLE